LSLLIIKFGITITGQHVGPDTVAIGASPSYVMPFFVGLTA